MKAVVVQHEEHEDIALFGPELKKVGFTLVKRFRGIERVDLDAALVVLLGGSMSVTDTAQHPFLDEELAFLRERLALGRPVLGICLGSQLLAAAAGATVTKGKNGRELGVAPVRWTKAGLEDLVIRGVPQRSTVAHWHEDTFSPVPDATLLASTDRYSQQAFRLGNSFGFQFHLELSGDDWARWCADPEPAAAREGVGKLRGAEAGNVALMARIAEHFARV